MQWTSEARLRKTPVHLIGLFPRVRVNQNDGVDRRPVLVISVDAPQVLIDQRAARKLPGLHRVVDLRDGSFLDFKWRGLLRKQR
jgi:hypothetical protein